MFTARTLLRLLTNIPTVGSTSAAEPTPAPAPIDGRPPIDWRPARAASAALLAWAADVARAHAAEVDDHDAIDRVQRYAAAMLAGQRACCLPADFVPSEVDALITASALIDAFSVDFGGASTLSMLASLMYAGLDKAAAPGPAIQPRGTLRELARLLAHLRVPMIAHGFDDAANDNAPRARRAAAGER